MLRRAVVWGLLAGWLPGAAAAGEFERTVPARPGGSLRLELDWGRVEVEPHDAGTVRVEASTRGWRDLEFEVESQGDEVRVRGRGSGLLAGFAGRALVRVRVPRRFDLDLRTGAGAVEVDEVDGALRATTSGGPLRVARVRGPVELRTSGGSIEADEIGGDLEARTSGGWVRVSEVRGRVAARTSGGGIEALDVRGPIELDTSGGSLSARFSGPPQGVLRTSGGSIDVEIPEGAAFDLDARTSGGRVEIEEEFAVSGQVERERVEGRVNGGGPKLELRTSGGDIRIQVD